MAIQSTATSNSFDAFEWPQELASFSDREVQWCINFFLEENVEINLRERKKYLVGMFEVFRKENKEFPIDGYNHEFMPSMVASLKNSNVIDLPWLKPDDQRLMVWLLYSGLHFIQIFLDSIKHEAQTVIDRVRSVHELYRLTTPIPQIVYPYPTLLLSSNERAYNCIVEYIDSLRFYTINAKYKQKLIDLIYQRWMVIKTPPKDTKWIEEENSEQMEWAWQYLVDQQKAITTLPPASSKERHSVILASLDMMYNLTNTFTFNCSDTRDLFLIKFKKAWSQKKFRDAGKNKKAHHIPLTKVAQTRLAKLAALNKESNSQLLEQLIEVEYRRVYLDKDGKERY